MTIVSEKKNSTDSLYREVSRKDGYFPNHAATHFITTAINSLKICASQLTPGIMKTIPSIFDDYLLFRELTKY
jgi:hypothetical protein